MRVFVLCEDKGKGVLIWIHGSYLGAIGGQRKDSSWLFYLDKIAYGLQSRGMTLGLIFRLEDAEELPENTKEEEELEKIRLISASTPRMDREVGSDSENRFNDILPAVSKHVSPSMDSNLKN